MACDVAELSRRLAAGDEEAVEVFHREYFEWLYGQARRACGRDEAFCLDVVQEAMIRIIRCVRPVESQARFRAWLSLVVRTAAYDQLRRERRWHARHEALTRSEEASAAEPGNGRLAWLETQISRMDPKLVRMLDLRYRRGWTLRQIGQKLGLTTGAVDGRLRRALERLKCQAGRLQDE